MDTTTDNDEMVCEARRGCEGGVKGRIWGWAANEVALWARVGRDAQRQFSVSV